MYNNPILVSTIHNFPLNGLFFYNDLKHTVNGVCLRYTVAKIESPVIVILFVLRYSKADKYAPQPIEAVVCDVYRFGFGFGFIWKTKK